MHSTSKKELAQIWVNQFSMEKMLLKAVHNRKGKLANSSLSLKVEKQKRALPK